MSTLVWVSGCRLLALVLLTMTLPALAASPIVVMEFGLKDDTLLPDVPLELARVATLAGYVRARLREQGHGVAEVVQESALTVQAGNGQLLAHLEPALALARPTGARWLVVGYMHKFSFLVGWTRAHVVEVASGRIVARAEADLRGGMADTRMTARTARNLADQVHALITTIEARRLAAPAP